MSRLVSRQQENSGSGIRVVHAITNSLSLTLIEGQLRYLRAEGLDVTLICSPGEDLLPAARREGFSTAPVPIEREIAPWRDLVSLCRIWRVLRRVRPVLTNVGTPKAGLLGGVAAWLAGVPCRIYTLRGLRLETTRGLKRWLLSCTERLACHSAHRVVCVSESLRRRAIDLKLVEPERTVVLGSGSSNGVNVARFSASPGLLARVGELRRELKIPADAPVIGFVGRFTRDKGLVELLRAFARVRERLPEARLLLVGDFEEGDPLPTEIRSMIESDPCVIWAGFADFPAPYYHLMNALVLPTHREGFPLVALEAAAAGKPVITTEATGARDAVLDQVTGLLVPVGDWQALASALQRILEDTDFAARLGRAAAKRVAEEFSNERVWKEVANLYRTMLAERGLGFQSQAGAAISTPRRGAVAE